MKVRSRILKHDFFLNEDLAELSDTHGKLFQGLWLLADREGKLENRPVRIKAMILPYKDCDVAEMLQDIASINAYNPLITLYQFDNLPLIKINNFEKHQSIHRNEAPSELPEPQEIPLEKKPRPLEKKPSLCQVSRSISNSRSRGRSKRDENIYLEIIEHLNKTANKKFSHKTKATVCSISARLEEGRTKEDFFHVHQVMTAKWGDDPKMKDYLTPTTLYRPANFEKYLNMSMPTALDGMSDVLRHNLTVTKQYLENNNEIPEKRSRVVEDHKQISCDIQQED